jgi:hypothetical protein
MTLGWLVGSGMAARLGGWHPDRFIDWGINCFELLACNGLLEIVHDGPGDLHAGSEPLAQDDLPAIVQDDSCYTVGWNAMWGLRGAVKGNARFALDACVCLLSDGSPPFICISLLFPSANTPWQ